MISDISSDPKIHVVVRSFNEENWIRSCLTTIFAQDYSNIFVTVVDSGSDDATTRIVREFKDVNLINTEDYMPGRAIMDGVRSDSMDCDYLFLVSAHCLLIGPDVLNSYVTTMQSMDDLAGIYGRQLPLHYTSPDDTRDLLNTFGDEFRVQKADSFFHNANSFVRMDVLHQIPFDEDIKHIEDRHWAKEVISAGWCLAYLPTASVYHHHGLNQHGSTVSFRAAGVASILRELQMSPQDTSFESIHMRQYLAPVVVLMRKEQNNDDAKRVIQILEKLDKSQPVFVIANEEPAFKREICSDGKFILRADIDVREDDSFQCFAKKVLNEVELELNTIVDALSFIDLSYRDLDLQYVAVARSSLFEHGRNGVVPAWRDFGNFWINENGKFVELDVSFDQKGQKSAIYRSALGQGGCIRASAIRSGAAQLEIDEFITTEDVSLIRRFQHD